MEKEIEGMFGLILNKLDGIESKVDGIESKVDVLESKVDKLESKVDGIESKVDALESKVDKFESKIELRMDNLESRQDEIYLLVKAIEHNTQVHRAEIDNLKYTVNNVEGTISAIGDVITKRKAI